MSEIVWMDYAHAPGIVQARVNAWCLTAWTDPFPDSWLVVGPYPHTEEGEATDLADAKAQAESAYRRLVGAHNWGKHEVMPDHEICLTCGVVKRSDGKNKPCSGKMPKVSLRTPENPPQPVDPGDSRWSVAMTDAWCDIAVGIWIDGRCVAPITRAEWLQLRAEADEAFGDEMKLTWKPGIYKTLPPSEHAEGTHIDFCACQTYLVLNSKETFEQIEIPTTSIEHGKRKAEAIEAGTVTE